MTDQLIILNRCNNYSGEGFFKFENGYAKMTVAFKEYGKKKYYWYLDGSFGTFKERTIVTNDSPVSDKPKNCGVFYEENEICYPMLYFGDLDILCNEFEKSSKIKVLPTYLAEIPQEEQEESNVKQEASDKEPKAENIPEFEMQIQKNTISENIPDSFWDVNESEIQKLLNTLPEDENMTSLIPGSKWVKAEDYLLGVIYDEFTMPLYLCYGFDLPWSENPPEKLNGYSQWIPNDCTRPHDKGYWVIYINAKTGERVK